MNESKPEPIILMSDIKKRIEGKKNNKNYIIIIEFKAFVGRVTLHFDLIEYFNAYFCIPFEK